MPRCVLDLYSSTYPGHTLIYPSADALLSSDNIDKSIGSCDILSTDVFGIGIRQTVSTQRSMPEARSRSESLDIFEAKPSFPEAVIFRSRHFPKLLFSEAVNHHRKRYCR